MFDSVLRYRVAFFFHALPAEVGGIYLGHQLVQASQHLEEKKRRAAAGAIDPVVTAEAGQAEVAVTVPGDSLSSRAILLRSVFIQGWVLE